MTRGPRNHSRLLTPAGTGAIGLIRIAGPDAARILSRVFRPTGHPAANSSGKRRGSIFEGNRLRYGTLIDAEEVIDDVLVTCVGSDDPVAFDISAHGGVRIVERILELLEREGAPLQTACEASNKFRPTRSVIEREALEMLGMAKTVRCARFVAWQRKHLAARIEALNSGDEANSSLAHQELRVMRDRFRGARHLIDGATLTIAGPPNSGKSTLFNRLMGRTAAIVSPHAGTTRDWVRGEIDLEGVPITLIDTAGRRDAADSLEKDAMARGASIGREADVQVLLVDGSQPLPVDFQATFAPPANVYCIPVVNKMDLKAAWRMEELSEYLGTDVSEPLAISAVRGDGVGNLGQGILEALGFKDWIEDAPAAFTARQDDLMARMLRDGPTVGSAEFAHGIRGLVGMFSDANG